MTWTFRLEVNALSFAGYGARAESEHDTKNSQEPLGVIASTTLSWAVFPDRLCAVHTCALGISVLLLVSIRLGYFGLWLIGDRLSQAQNIGFWKVALGRDARVFQGNGGEMNPHRNAPTTTSARFRLVFIALIERRKNYIWPFGFTEEAVLGWSLFIFVISLMSTRRFFARPAAVLSLATC